MISGGRGATWWKLLGVLVTAAIGFELAVRTVLFSPGLDGTLLAARLRRPEAVAHEEEDLYWWLRTRYGLGVGPEAAIGSHHPELGWTRWPGADGAAGIEHPDKGPLAGRRRVLLYGDSFSACQTPDEECFQGLLERSSLGESHTLLNYGVHAYGLDQILMLLRRTVDLHRAEHPHVIVGLLVDRDLDRAGLSYRGGMSKPCFDVVDGQLALRPPLGAGVLPPRPRAALGARLLVHALGLEGGLHELVCGHLRALERNRERCRLLLEALAAELSARELDACVLLFHSQEYLDRTCWEERLVTTTLDRIGARWRSTRSGIVSHAAATGRPLSDYFDTTGHLNGLGNFAAFRAIEDELLGRSRDPDGGLDGEPDGWTDEELLGPLTASAYSSVRTGGQRGVVRHEIGRRAQFPRAEDRPRLVFRVGRRGPSEVAYELAGRASSFSATVCFATLARERSGRVGVSVIADGAELLRLVLQRGQPPRPFEVDLTGCGRLTIRVDDGGDGIDGDVVALTRPSFVRADT